MIGELFLVLGASPLGALPSLAAVYVACLVVGGGLLVISTIFAGDADVDVDASVDLDAGIDVDVDAGLDVDAAGPDAAVGDASAMEGHAGGLSLAEWFSVHFVVYFLAMFGLVGTVLSYMTSHGPLLILLVSVGSGLVAGQAVHQLLRFLRRTSGGRATTDRDYLNRPARVTIAIPAGKRGEVAARVRARERYVAAAARHPDVNFEVGDRVVVVGYANGLAEVISQDEHEFLNEP